jgi:hypothetical protein
VTFTKQIALHDKITIDGTDMSNAFRSFNLTSDATSVDVSGFSVSGTDESLSGPKAQGFQGDCFQTSENEEFLWTLHYTDEIFMVEWQPDGLADNTRPIWKGMCQLRTFDPAATRGDARVFPCTFTAADDAGIYISAT